MKWLRHNMYGFSMVEMMIALFILTIAILGLASVTMTSIQTNQQNELRNTAVHLTTETAERVMAESIDSLVTQVETRQMNVRGINKQFNVTRTVATLTTDLRQVNIRVSYAFKGATTANTSVIYKHRAM